MKVFDAQVSRRGVLLGAAAGAALLTVGAAQAEASTPFTMPSRASTIARFGTQRPRYWGEHVPGTISRFSTSTAMGRQAICLTFDACGGRNLRYDAALIATLRRYRVPATLFINRDWAQHNPTILASLLHDPLFEIENHGVRHVPLSVTGRSAWGIAGTRNVGEIWDEVGLNFLYMNRYWGYSPRFMRTGTAYADDVAARVVPYMGERIVSYSINGDGGATYPSGTVYTEVLKARAGDIVLSHMNHPGGGTAPGIARAIPVLKARGYRFRTLSQVLPTTPTPTPTPAPTSWTTLRFGSRGDGVKAVQRIVHVQADGIFGPLTLGAVKAYQSSHRLVSDGIVGPLTAAAMGLSHS